jgi:predicted transcriptional regulator
MVKRNADPPKDLTRRERQIMDLIFQAGQATAAEVRAGLPDAPSDSAVRTLLRLLEERGHLVHEEVGQKYVYRPTTPRAEAGRSALRQLVDTFFGGSVERVAAALLDERSRDLDPATRARLEDRIRAARAQATETDAPESP